MAGGRRHTRGVVASLRRRPKAPRRAVWTIVGVVFVALAVISPFTVRGLRIVQLRHQLQASLVQRDEALIAREALEHQLSLKDDLATIEDVARFELGWILPGEIRVVFVQPSASSEGE